MYLSLEIKFVFCSFDNVDLYNSKLTYIRSHLSVSELVYLPTEYTGWGRGIVRCSLLPHRLYYVLRERIVVVKQMNVEFSLVEISIFKTPEPKKVERMSVCT